jgi:hypothetical protein
VFESVITSIPRQVSETHFTKKNSN